MLPKDHSCEKRVDEVKVHLMSLPCGHQQYSDCSIEHEPPSFCGPSADSAVVKPSSPPPQIDSIARMSSREHCHTKSSNFQVSNK